MATDTVSREKGIADAQEEDSNDDGDDDDEFEEILAAATKRRAQASDLSQPAPAKRHVRFSLPQAGEEEASPPQEHIERKEHAERAHSGTAQQKPLSGKVCFPFAQTGRCARGNTCKMEHVQSSCIQNPEKYTKYDFSKDEHEDEASVGAQNRSAVAEALRMAALAKRSSEQGQVTEWLSVL